MTKVFRIFWGLFVVVVVCFFFVCFCADRTLLFFLDSDCRHAYFRLPWLSLELPPLSICVNIMLFIDETGQALTILYLYY